MPINIMLDFMIVKWQNNVYLNPPDFHIVHCDQTSTFMNRQGLIKDWDS